jgi:hypothetical protein
MAEAVLRLLSLALFFSFVPCILPPKVESYFLVSPAFLAFSSALLQSS